MAGKGLPDCQSVSPEHRGDPSSEVLSCFAASLHQLAEEKVANTFGSQIDEMSPAYRKVLCLAAVREELLAAKRSVAQAPQSKLSDNLLSTLAQAEAGVNSKIDLLYPPETEDAALAKFIATLRATIGVGK